MGQGDGVTAAKPCFHPIECQIRLEGGKVTWCSFCGAYRYNDLKVWHPPSRLKS